MITHVNVGQSGMSDLDIMCVCGWTSVFNDDRMWGSSFCILHIYIIVGLARHCDCVVVLIYNAFLLSTESCPQKLSQI